MLGHRRAQALPGFHAFSGADITGRFARIGKQTWFKLFLDAGEDVLQALGKLGDEIDFSPDLQNTLAKFVCSAYCPKGINISHIPELRWHLFCKHMAESEKLPPTIGALKQHILRAHVQARVWDQASLYNQELLDPKKNGYCLDNDGHLKPTTTEFPPAPLAIVEMVRCQCKSGCSTNRYSCKSVNLPCTDLCLCSSVCENDADSQDFENESDDEIVV